MAWFLLSIAIATEVTATLALRASDGMTRLTPSIVVVVGYAISFIAMARALKSLQVGATYAIWSGVGTAAVTIAAIWLFNERPSWPAFAGIALIVAGVIILTVWGGVRQ